MTTMYSISCASMSHRLSQFILLVVFDDSFSIFRNIWHFYCRYFFYSLEFVGICDIRLAHSFPTFSVLIFYMQTLPVDVPAHMAINFTENRPAFVKNYQNLYNIWFCCCCCSNWPSQIGQQSLHNRSCLWGFVLSRSIWFSSWCRGFCHRTEADLFFFRIARLSLRCFGPCGNSKCTMYVN